MTERLIIRNFAGLENIEIEIGRINIFIGPQASGKSVCAKCLYWFKSFLPNLLEDAQSGESKRKFESNFINIFKEYFPGAWRNEKQMFLRYEIDNYFVQLENINNNLKISYSDLFMESAKIIRKESAAALRSGYRSNAYIWESSRIVNTNDYLRDETGNAINITQSYVLAGRSFFSALKGATLTFLAQSPVIDPFLREFISLYELTRKYFLNNDISRNKDIFEKTSHIIKGKIEIKTNEDFIRNIDGRRVSLANASSGQQESFTLLLILIHTALTELHGEELHAIYIEEPEAHLFPESQRAIAQLIIIIANIRSDSLQTIITTHSPYLLASFNNLIYAHQLSEQLKNQPEKLKALYEIVPKNQQAPLSDFCVYGLENGRAHSLIDAESELLSADLLDSASDITGEQFSALMALDPNTQGE